MIDILMGLLQFLIENPHILVCSGIVVFFALMFLESDYIKHYGEEEDEVRLRRKACA